MRSIAIICEYNPFHRGHLALISEIKRLYPDYAVISVMSGNTVQRGEFAVSDKYERAKNAVLCSSDIVAELPFPYSVSAGEQFARAGVFIADALRCERLVFGSSDGDIGRLSALAEKLSSPELEEAVGKEVARDRFLSFIAAKENAFFRLYGEHLPEGGNDTLGTEYIRAIRALGSGMIPEAVKRTEGLSATAARAALLSGDQAESERLIPECCTHNTLGGGFGSYFRYFAAAMTLLPRTDDGSGISNAVRSAVLSSSDYEGFVSALPTKTYTLACLKRRLFSDVFGLSDEEKNLPPKYTILLGASVKGLRYLSEHKKEITIPVLTKVSELSKLPPDAVAAFGKAEKAERFFRLGQKDAGYSPFSVPFFAETIDISGK